MTLSHLTTNQKTKINIICIIILYENRDIYVCSLPMGIKIFIVNEYAQNTDQFIQNSDKIIMNKKLQMLIDLKLYAYDKKINKISPCNYQVLF